MWRITKKSQAEQGFTVLELLIATLVFATALVIITTAILQFSNLYYEGVTDGTVQDTARTIVDQISQAIQFNGGEVAGAQSVTDAGNNVTSQARCIGGQRYSYIPGYQLEDNAPDTAQHQTYHAFVVDDTNCASDVQAQDVSLQYVSGRELLSPHMRLAAFDVSQVSGHSDLYTIHVRVVFGDDPLLYSPSGDSRGPASPDAACLGGIGGRQFCAVSDIATTVVKRVQ